MTDLPPERVQAIAIQKLNPRYGDKTRPAFRRDNPSEASIQWLDTKVNFLNEMMKFIPRTFADKLSSHSYSKDSVKGTYKSDTRADSYFNKKFIKPDDNGGDANSDFWKGTQSELGSQIFNSESDNVKMDDGTAINLSQFTGMLGVPYDGSIGMGAYIDNDGVNELRPVFMSTTNQQKKAAYNFYYTDYKGQKVELPADTKIVPMLSSLKGDEYGKYFGEGVDFHPTVLDMRHTLLKPDADINGNGVIDNGEGDMTTTALTIPDYSKEYLNNMGVTSPIVDYSTSFKNFMSNSPLSGIGDQFTKHQKFTYNKLDNVADSSGSGDFSDLLNKIKFKASGTTGDAIGLKDYVPNIYELARSGVKIDSTWTDKEVFELSMLMLESRRRFTYAMSTVFGAKKDKVDLKSLVKAYSDPKIWEKTDPTFKLRYTTVTTATGNQEKVFNYYLPETSSDSNNNMNFLKERAVESQVWSAATDVYSLGLQTGIKNQLSWLDGPDVSADFAKCGLDTGALDELKKLKDKISSLTDMEVQPKMIHEIMLKMDDIKTTLVPNLTLNPASDSATTPKYVTDNSIKILDTTGVDHDTFKKYSMWNMFQYTTKKITAQAGQFLQENISVGDTSKTTPTESLTELFLKTRYPIDSFGDQTAVADQAKNVLSAFAKMAKDKFEDIKTQLVGSDSVQGIMDLPPQSKDSNGNLLDRKFSDDIFLTFLEQNVDKKMRLFNDISSTDKFNQLMYGTCEINGSKIGYMPADFAKSSGMSPYLTRGKRLQTTTNDNVTSLSSVADRMYLDMTLQMQKMANFYMMAMFASPHEGDQNDLNFLRSLKDAQTGNIDDLVTATTNAGKAQLMSKTVAEMSWDDAIENNDLVATPDTPDSKLKKEALLGDNDGHLLSETNRKGKLGQDYKNIKSVLQQSLKVDYDKESTFIKSLHDRLSNLHFDGSVNGGDPKINGQDLSYYIPNFTANTSLSKDEFHQRMTDLKTWAESTDNSNFNLSLTGSTFGDLSVDRKSSILGILNNTDIQGIEDQIDALKKSPTKTLGDDMSNLTVLFKDAFTSGLAYAQKPSSTTATDLLDIRQESSRNVPLTDVKKAADAISNLIDGKWGMNNNSTFDALVSNDGAASVELKTYLKNLKMLDNKLNSNTLDFRGLTGVDRTAFLTYVHDLVLKTTSPFYQPMQNDADALKNSFLKALAAVPKSGGLDKYALSIPDMVPVDKLFKTLAPKLDSQLKDEAIISQGATGITKTTRKATANWTVTVETQTSGKVQSHTVDTRQFTQPYKEYSTEFYKDTRTVTSDMNTVSEKQTDKVIRSYSYQPTSTLSKYTNSVVTTDNGVPDYTDPKTGKFYPGSPADTWTTTTTTYTQGADSDQEDWALNSAPSWVTAEMEIPETPPHNTIDGLGNPIHGVPQIAGNYPKDANGIEVKAPAVNVLKDTDNEPVTGSNGTPREDGKHVIDKILIPLFAGSVWDCTVNPEKYSTFTMGIKSTVNPLGTSPSHPDVALYENNKKFDLSRRMITQSATHKISCQDFNGTPNLHASTFIDCPDFVNKWSYGQLFYDVNMDTDPPIASDRSYKLRADVATNWNLNTDDCDQDPSRITSGSSKNKAPTVTYYKNPNSSSTRFVSMIDEFTRDFQGIEDGYNDDASSGQPNIYQQIAADESGSFMKKFTDQGKTVKHTDHKGGQTRGLSTYDILMVAADYKDLYDNMTTALTDQYNILQGKIQKTLDVKTADDIKKLYYNEFYMKGDFQNLMMSSEFKGRYADGVKGTDMIGSAKRSGWYESDGTIYSQKAESTSMDFGAFDYRVSTDRVSLMDDIARDTSNSADGYNQNTRSKRKRKVVDYFQALTSSDGVNVAGSLRADAVGLNTQIMHVGKVNGLVHMDQELISLYQEIQLAGDITDIYNENTKYEESKQADQDKEDTEKHNQEEADSQQADAKAAAEASARRAAMGSKKG